MVFYKRLQAFISQLELPQGQAYSISHSLIHSSTNWIHLRLDSYAGTQFDQVNFQLSFNFKELC